MIIAVDLGFDEDLRITILDRYKLLFFKMYILLKY